MYTYYFLFIYQPSCIRSSVTMKKNIVRLQIVSIIFELQWFFSCSNDFAHPKKTHFFRFHFIWWPFILDMYLWFPVMIAATINMYVLLVLHKVFLWFSYSPAFIGVNLAKRRNNRKLNDHILYLNFLKIEIDSNCKRSIWFVIYHRKLSNYLILN